MQIDQDNFLQRWRKIPPELYCEWVDAVLTIDALTDTSEWTRSLIDFAKHIAVDASNAKSNYCLIALIERGILPLKVEYYQTPALVRVWINLIKKDGGLRNMESLRRGRTDYYTSIDDAARFLAVAWEQHQEDANSCLYIFLEKAPLAEMCTQFINAVFQGKRKQMNSHKNSKSEVAKWQLLLPALEQVQFAHLTEADLAIESFVDFSEPEQTFPIKTFTQLLARVTVNQIERLFESFHKFKDKKYLIRSIRLLTSAKGTKMQKAFYAFLSEKHLGTSFRFNYSGTPDTFALALQGSLAYKQVHKGLGELKSFLLRNPRYSVHSYEESETVAKWGVGNIALELY